MAAAKPRVRPKEPQACPQPSSRTVAFEPDGRVFTLEVNGRKVQVREGSTILDAAKALGITIPTLCHHPDLTNAGACRLCVVEVEGCRTLQAACTYKVTDGMKVRTTSPAVRRTRRAIIELLLASHFGDCQTCVRNTTCELQTLAKEHGVEAVPYEKVASARYQLDAASDAIVRDPDKCILCTRCVRACSELQAVGIFEVHGRGVESKLNTFCGHDMSEVPCIQCGQCVTHCPTGALRAKEDVDKVWEAIDDPTKHVVIQTAPAPRAAIAEEFGIPPGRSLTKQMNTALKLMGFDRVFDTNLTADLTIMEEGHELLDRLKRALVDKDPKVKLPMITSCSPGWIKFIEHRFPDHLDHLSSCKSPQQMFGAIIKTYYARKAGVDPASIVTVSLMPCSAKKFEANRPEMRASGFKDVDYVLTTRELASMMKQAGINPVECEPSEFDDPLGLGSGAGLIFGATGGVMEAALRTAYEVVTGREVPFKNLAILPVRGLGGVREATIRIEDPLPAWSFLDGVELRVAVAHTTGNAKKVMERVVAGNAPWHFIEVMACPGGCLGGGGQPIPVSDDVRMARAKAIYDEDMGLPLRKSHENPQVKMLYKEFLERPLGHMSHELLHTTYTKRGYYDRLGPWNNRPKR